MGRNEIEITCDTALNEAQHEVSVYGIKITRDGKATCYRDLCTDRERIEKLCEILKGDLPDDALLPELFEDYLYS